MLVFEENQINTLDKYLKFKYFVLLWFCTFLYLQNNLGNCFKAKSSICVQMWDNLADTVFCKNSPQKNWSKTACYALLGET